MKSKFTKEDSMAYSTSKVQRLFPILFMMVLLLFVVPGGVRKIYAQDEDYRTYLPKVLSGCQSEITYQPPYDREIEVSTLEAINYQRSINGGLKPLVMSTSLVQIARYHSEDMASNDFFAHQGSSGEDPWTRYDWICEEFSWKGEIIAVGYGDVESVINGWMNSQGHRDLILKPEFTHAGVGYIYVPDSEWGFYWTVDFGTNVSSDNSSLTSVCPLTPSNETFNSTEGGIGVTLCE